MTTKPNEDKPSLSDAEHSVARGDVVRQPGEEPLTDEEKRVAGELKAKEEAEAKAKAEAEAKAKAEAEEEDDPDNPGQKRRKDTRVPLARHKEILERERAEKERALAKLAQYQGAEDLAKTNEEIQKAENKLIELEGQHAKLITDGRADEAAKTMTEIRKLEREINRKQTALETAAAESRAYERARYDVTVERLEAAYPVLNPDNEEHYDPEKVRKILSVSRAYQADGMPPSKALQEAVKDLLGEPETKKQEAAVETTPRVDEAAKKKAAREEEARRKAAEAAGKQPPDTSKTGVESDKLGSRSLSGADVMKMSYDDFSKLSEADLSRMRGDVPSGPVH